MGRLRDLLGDAYISAGLQGRWHVTEDLFMDITDIEQPDRFFDVIICYHVLEHVEDDARAMRELCRVLKDDGLAIIDVPWIEALDRTDEDPSITTPDGRVTAFGLSEHVRVYGKDFPDRLRAAGFHAEVVRARDVYSYEDAARQGFPREKFFLCAKSAVHPAFGRRRIGGA